MDTASENTVAEQLPIGVERAAVPERLGRYVVLETLGQGGMGAVYRAFDPELDRSVALKVIQSHGGAAFRERLRREARALAKLSHPHVLPVYDVGTWNDELFLATEYVQGEDLRSWLEQRRGWRDVLDVFLQAARGLTAAHRQGIIHRDFKPANIMLGRDGRVRVLDFGLAQLDVGSPGAAAETHDEADQGEKPARPEPRVGAPSAASVSTGALTQAGTVLGSPPYMAPELHQGAAASVFSDQYAFCLSLWEALTGTRPFAGVELGALYRAKQSPPSPGSTATDEAPRWLLDIAARGMAFERDARWPSMDAVLAMLERDPARKRRKMFVVLAGAVVVLGAFGGAAAYVRAQSQRCAGASLAIEQRWNDERRQTVHDAIEGTALSYAAATSQRVATGLDSYFDSWARARTDACEATHARGEQSLDDLSLRMRCFDGQLAEATALIEVLTTADDVAVRRAVTAVAGLPRAVECADVEALRANLPPTDPEVGAKVDALEQQFAEAKALESAGRYDDALAMIATVLAAAEEIGHRPLLARLRFRQAWMKIGAGRDAEAEPELVEAYRLALELAMLDTAAAAAAALVWNVASKPGRRAEGKAWGLHAAALAEAVDRDEARAWVANNLGLIARHERDYDESFAQLRRAVELKSRVYGPDSPEVALPLMNLGATYLAVDDLPAARDALARAVEIQRTALGPEHPSVAAPLANLGVVEQRAGRLDEAVRAQEQAIAIWAAALGPDNPKSGMALVNLASTFHELGRHEEAKAALLRALAIVLANEGASSPNATELHLRLAEVAIAQHEYDEAVKLAEQVVAAAASAPTEPLHVEACLILAQALWDAPRGDRVRARALAEQAGTIAAAGGEELADLAARIASWQAEHR